VHPRAVLDGCRKSRHHRDFFFCSLFVLYPHFFVLTVLASSFCPYCTTHTIQTSMPPAGFERTISASQRPQTLALDRSATGIRSPDRPARSDSLDRLRYPDRPLNFVPSQSFPKYYQLKLLHCRIPNEHIVMYKYTTRNRAYEYRLLRYILFN
jgi:hypothetical protein